MGRHQALPTLGQDRWLSALRRTVQSWKGRTLSPTARLLVLVGVIAGAVVMTIMVAAVFISRGAGAEPSTNVALTGTPTPSHSPTPKATPTPSKRETITPMVTPTVTPTITRANGHPTVAFYSTDRWNDGFVGVITITNTTNQPLRWELTFELRGADIQQVWQAEVHQSDSGASIARGLAYNALIGPGDRAQFGFRAVGTSRARLRDCTLNGESCQIRRG